MTRNITPNIARKSRIIPPEPVLNAGCRNRCMSSIGSSGAQLPEDEDGEDDDGDARRRSSVGALSQPRSGASMRPKTRATIPMIDSTAPTGSSLASSRVARRRHEEPAGHEGDGDDRDVDEEHRAVPEVAEQPAADQRPEAAGGPGDAGPDGDGLGALLGREDVDDDRQRRRHDQRGGGAHHGAAGDELPHRASTPTANAAATRNRTRPSCSVPLRPKRSPRAPVENSSPANTSE